MRKILLYILLFPALCFAQHNFPKNNEIILAFVDANIGKRVGGGVCYELVHKAIKKADRNWKWNGIKTYGRRILFKRNVKLGDIIVFKNVIINEGSFDYHVSILYKILQKGYGYLMAEQNYEDNPNFITKRDSKVVISPISSLHTKKGHIRIYRHN